MKVVLLYNGMLQHGMAAANRTISIASALKSAKNEVEILSPFGFANKTLHGPTIVRTSKIGDIGYSFGVFMKTHPLNYRFRFIGISYYILAKHYSYLRLLFYLFRQKGFVDVVYIYEFGILYSLLIRLVAINSVVVYELCEIPYFSIKNDLKRSVLRYLRFWLNYRYADGIVVISENLKELVYQRLNFDRSRVFKLPVLTSYSQEENVNFCSTSDQIPEKFIVHTGSITERKDGFMTVLKALFEANNRLDSVDRLHIVTTGNLDTSDVKDKLLKLTDEEKDLVHFVGRQDIPDLVNLLRNAKGAVIFKYRNEQNMYNSPTKLADYLINGVCVVATPVGELGRIIINGWNGYLLDESDFEGLVRCILQIATEDQCTVKRNAMMYAAENFHIGKQGLLFSTWLRELLH